MGNYGRYEFGKFGSGISCSADGSPVAKVAGVQLAWAAIVAVAEARKFKDEDTVEAGEKFIRYGTVVCRITSSTTATEVGKFMPYMTGTLSGTGNIINTLAAVGGITRVQSLAEGDVFLVNRSVHEDDVLSDYPEVFDGGRMYKQRLLVVGYGDGTGGYPDAATDAADLTALGIPAILAASFKAALPQISFVNEGNAAPVAA